MVGATSIVLYNQNKLTPSTASIAEVLKQIEADRNVEKIKEKKQELELSEPEVEIEVLESTPDELENLEAKKIIEKQEEQNQPPKENPVEEKIENEVLEVPSIKLSIIDKLVSWGYRSYYGSREIDSIIIHSVYDALGNDPYSVNGVIEEFRIYKVASHYLIDQKGNIYQLVNDNNIAYHAGSGIMPDGRTGINNFSIGIEMIYHKTESPKEIQYQTLAKLVRHKMEEYNIPLTNIVGHQDISPSKKTDPWNFDWEKFKKIIQ
ncbi:MAG: N-acetylmuramoyl-L-alanine amidase, partial [Patescibacteria group bacterium]|nr:N-acetylmuramoyl-L-alanine amidase [Patescibacteria group bacterium]